MLWNIFIYNLAYIEVMLKFKRFAQIIMAISKYQKMNERFSFLQMKNGEECSTITMKRIS